MKLAAQIAVGFVAFIHIYIVALEMFLWSRAVHVFGIPKDLRDSVLIQTLLKNQGLYNGFLVAGLIWGLLHPVPEIGKQIQFFFLACVAVAGLYGAMTAKPVILLIQTLPAAIALALLFLSR
jgi:putative membrane protein